MEYAHASGLAPRYLPYFEVRTLTLRAIVILTYKR